MICGKVCRIISGTNKPHTSRQPPRWYNYRRGFFYARSLARVAPLNQLMKPRRGPRSIPQTYETGNRGQLAPVTVSGN